MIVVQEKTCLSCKKFRLEDPYSGLCRLDSSIEHYPMKRTDDSCEMWQDGGQQYYIRTGWIKRALAKEKEADNKS